MQSLFLVCVLFIVSPLGLGQSGDDIVCPSSRPKAISQVSVEDIYDVEKSLTGINSHLRHPVPLPLDCQNFISHVIQPDADASKSLTLDADDTAHITRDERSAGNSFYGWALEINGVNLDLILRNGICRCDEARQAKLVGDGYLGFSSSAEREADNGNVRSGFNISPRAEFHKWQSAFLDFQDCEVPNCGLFINKNSRQWRTPIRESDGDGRKSLSSLMVKDNVSGSNDPSIRGDDEAACSSICNIDADHGWHKSPTGLFLSKGRGLGEHCGAK